LSFFYLDDQLTIWRGPALETLRSFRDESFDCVVTSPPYWGLRDYGVDGQLGLEDDPEDYIAALVAIFHEIKRVLTSTGTVWLNLGDSYARSPRKGASGTPTGRNGRGEKYAGALRGAGGLPPKNLLMLPARVAIALQADGWTLRSDVIWHKPNAMPDPGGKYRPACSHEHLFLLVKSDRYFYDYAAVKEPAKWERWGDQTIRKPQPGRASWIKPKSKQELVGETRPPGRGDTYSGFNERYAGDSPVDRKTRLRRDVWSVPTASFPGAHFAVFPPRLIEPCILAGCPEGGVVLDPFFGAGTTALAALSNGRRCVGVELSEDYCQMALDRVRPQATA
jgi:DNA modification methylase